MNERLTQCDNCGHECPEGELGEPIDLWERLDPGATVPAGECPECGALAYLIDTEDQVTTEETIPQLYRRLGFEWIAECGSWSSSEEPGVWHPTVTLRDQRPPAVRSVPSMVLSTDKARALAQLLWRHALESDAMVRAMNEEAKQEEENA